MLWGVTWWQHDGWKHYLATRKPGVAFYLVPSQW